MSKFAVDENLLLISHTIGNTLDDVSHLGDTHFVWLSGCYKNQQKTHYLYIAFLPIFLLTTCIKIFFSFLVAFLYLTIAD